MAKKIKVTRYLLLNDNLVKDNSTGIRNELVKAKVKQSQVKKQSLKVANDIVQSKIVNFVQKGINLEAKNKSRRERKLLYS